MLKLEDFNEFKLSDTNVLGGYVIRIKTDTGIFFEYSDGNGGIHWKDIIGREKSRDFICNEENG